MAKITIGRKAQLNPVASPTDTFVRVAEPQRSPLWGLADSLAKFDSDLQPFLDKKRKEDEAGQVAKAQADFFKNNQEGLAEGVRKGVIPAYYSPHYRKAYQAMVGDTKASNFAGDFKGAYLLWDGKESDDPQAFDNFLNDYSKKWLGDVQDPEILQGLMPGFRQTVEQVRQAYQQERANRYYKKGVDAATSSVAANIDKMRIDGLSPQPGVKPGDDAPPTGIDYEGIWNESLKRRQLAISVGMKAEDFDQQMFATFAAKAIEHKDPDLFKLLDKEMPGTNIKFSDTPEGLKLKMETERTLLSMAEKDERESKQKTDAELEARYKANMNEVLKIFATDPNAVIPDDVLDDMARHDGDVRKKVADAREAMNNAKVKQADPAAVAEIYTDLMNGAGKERVLKAIADGTIAGDPKMIAELAGFADRFEANGGQGKLDAVMKRPNVQIAMDQIKNASQDNSPAGIAARGAQGIWGAEAGWTEMGSLIRRDVEKGLAQFIAENPEATTAQLEDKVIELATRAKAGIGIDQNSGQQVYTPPQDLAGANPQDPQRQLDAAKKRAEQQQADQQAEQDPWTRVSPEALQGTGQGNWDGQQPPIITALSEGQRKLVEQEAQRLGVPPELVVQRIWDNIKKRRQGGQQNGVGQAPQGISGTGGTDAFGGSAGNDTQLDANSIDRAVGLPDGSTQAVLEGLGAEGAARQMANEQITLGRSPDDTKRIAGLGDDRLSGREGQVAALLGSIRSKEAPRGYGQVYAGVPAEFRDVDVSKMTLNQVLDWQRKVVAAGSKSSAAGGYQFIRKTLVKTMQEMGLNGSEVWTPELQDKMAVHLLNGRGLSDYLAGRISRERFANNLAKEWASLPVVTGAKRGQSYYAGDGLNKSFHDPADILALVDDLKNGTNSNVQVASLDPNFLPGASDGFVAKDQVPVDTSPEYVYSLIPKTDNRGEDQMAKFMQWNPDPVGNEEKNLSEVRPEFKPLVQRIRELSGVNFVVASGKRTKEQQKLAIKWGWSKKEDSLHLDGDAIDIWPLDEKGRIVFDEDKQTELGRAIKQAMKEQGLDGEWGGDWKDLPHIELKPKKA